MIRKSSLGILPGRERMFHGSLGPTTGAVNGYLGVFRGKLDPGSGMDYVAGGVVYMVAKGVPVDLVAMLTYQVSWGTVG